MKDLANINEQLIAHNCVRSIHIDIDRKSLKYNLLLSITNSENLDASEYRLYFYDVSDVRIESFGGGLTQFMHLKIDQINGQLDRSSYRLSDLESEKVSFIFSDFEQFD